MSKSNPSRQQVIGQDSAIPPVTFKVSIPIKTSTQKAGAGKHSGK
jgi:hypothetical protein